MVILAASALLLMSCASGKPGKTPAPVALETFKCAAGEFRGLGTGESEAEALNAALSELSMQINSSIEVSRKLKQRQQSSNEKELTSTEYNARTIIKSALSNAHDARILHKSETGAVVCMSKENAAKGFKERQQLIADSLEVVSYAGMGTEHPKHKNSAWHKAQTLWNEFTRIQNMLDDWGVESANLSASETYSKTKDDYKSYCVKQKTFWEEKEEGDCSKAVFSELSKKVKIEKSKCSSGLNLRFSCSERCSSSGFGVECFFQPVLSIEACGGEQYSILTSKKPVLGDDMHNISKAKEKLIQNLPNADFFAQWETEIKEWAPQCTE